MFHFLIKTNYFLLLSQIECNAKKKVTFSNHIKYYFIQNRSELLYENLYDDLWWTDRELKKSKNELFEASYNFKKIYPELNNKEIDRLIFNCDSD
jgi:hypothetical protein